MTTPPPTREFPPPVEGVVRALNRPLEAMWRRGFRVLFVLDAMALYSAMLLIMLVRFGADWPRYSVARYLIGFSFAAGVQLLVNYFSGLYEREPRLGHRAWFPRTTLAMAIGTAFDALVVLISGRYLMPRGNLAALFAFGSVALAANRQLSRALARRRQGPSRVLLAGEGASLELATRHFADLEGRRDAVIVGTVTEVDELEAAIRSSDPTDVLLLDLASFDSVFPGPLTDVDEQGIGLHQRVSGREALLGLRSVHQIAGLPFTRVHTDALSSHQRRLKRLFDLTVLVVGAPVFLLTLALLAAYVRSRAGTPVLYRQVRVGRDERTFTLFKFRTMRTDAEGRGPQLSSADDPRVVPGLRWMRQTRADELPQLWNVLRGEMSLVGPRPERPELTAAIGREVAGYDRRHVLSPGLTGLAQVHGRYATHADYKLGYDLQYAVNWSLVLDMQIILRTVWVVIARRV
jgi:exopolysaccharide biosynthesis polyprenyl glycosylphosphotransferase